MRPLPSGNGKSACLRLVEQHLLRNSSAKVVALEHASGSVSSFYRELGERFGVELSPRNRWGGFKVLRERWIAHLDATHIRPTLIIDEAQEMPSPVLNELRLLTSDRFDSRSLLSVVLAGDGRLNAKLAREDLLPLGSRVRIRLLLEQAEREALAQCLVHLMSEAGNANLMTPELVQTLAEHAMGNYRILTCSAAELLGAAVHAEITLLDEKLYLEHFSAQGRKRRRTAS